MARADLVAHDHYLRSEALSRRCAARVLAQWDYLGPEGFLGDPAGWGATTTEQIVAALLAAEYIAQQASLANIDQSPYGVDPAMLTTTSAGGPQVWSRINQALRDRLQTQIAAGRDPVEATLAARARVGMIAGNEVRQAASNAAHIQLTATEGFDGYVRFLTPPSCPRCVILAGRIYKAMKPFRRHPRCDCVHVPRSSLDLDDPAVQPYVSPEGYFASLSEAQQDAQFGAANAQAIRDGADIRRVVNVDSRGAGLVEFTTAAGQKVVRARLTPAEIYRMAGSDRDEAIRLLQQEGYLKLAPTPARPAGPAMVGAYSKAQIEALRRDIDAVYADLGDDPSEWFVKDLLPVDPQQSPDYRDLVPGEGAYRALDRVLAVGGQIDTMAAPRAAAIEDELKRQIEEQVGPLQRDFEKAKADRNAAFADYWNVYDRREKDAQVRALREAGITGYDSFDDWLAHGGGEPGEVTVYDHDLATGIQTAHKEVKPKVPYQVRLRYAEILHEDVEHGEIARAEAAQVAAKRRVEQLRTRLDRHPLGWAAVQPESIAGEARRRAVLELMDEVLPGGSGRNAGAEDQPKITSWRSSTALYMGEVGRQKAKPLGKGKTRAAMDYALQSYPVQWLRHARSRIPVINVKAGASRGWNDFNGAAIRLSDTDLGPQSPGTLASGALKGRGIVHTAVHELGHTMEQAIPGLREAEWALLSRRAGVGFGQPGFRRLPGLQPLYGDSREVAFFDRFAEPYSGKTYASGAARDADGLYRTTDRWGMHPRDTRELFTTGVESLLAGSRYFTYSAEQRQSWHTGAQDDEFRRFILGVLFVLGR